MRAKLPMLRRRGVMMLIAVLAALVGVDVIIRLNAAALSPWDPRCFETKAAAYKKAPPDTVLLMGSSRAAYAFSPPEFRAALGRPAFNLGLPATKPYEWVLLCRDLLAAHRPAMIVLGINASEVADGVTPIEGAATFMRLPDVIHFTLDEGVDTTILGNYSRAALGRVWALYGRRYAIRVALDEQLGRLYGGYGEEARRVRGKNGLRSAPDGYDHPWLAGQLLRTLPERLEDHHGVLSASVPRFDASGRSLMHFDALLADVRRLRIPIVVAYLPNSPRTQQRWSEVEPAIREAIRSDCRRHGIAMIELKTPLQDEDYIDETHLGLDGARRVSAELAARVAELALLPPPSPRDGVQLARGTP